MAFLTSQSIQIAAAPEAIWQVVTDISNAAKVITGIKAIKVI
ncbi:SRPBCC family protein [Rheinheimera sp. WS51]